MENLFNPPKSINEVPENLRTNVSSSFGIYCQFQDEKPKYIAISFDGGLSYTCIYSFSSFVDYLNYYQQKQPTKKIFFLEERKNRFLALLESNKPLTVTI